MVASFDDIEAFTYADTEYEAINCLSEENINLYEDLKEDRENTVNWRIGELKNI